MSRRVWAAAVILMAAVIGYLIQDLVLHQVIRPILRVLTRISFVLGIYWRTQDQELIWGAFVLVAVLLAAATLAGLWPGRSRPSGSHPERTGRLQFWVKQLQSLEEGIYYRWRFSQEFGRLIMEKLSLSTGESPPVLMGQIRAGQLEVPDEVRRFLLGTYQVKLHEYYSGSGPDRRAEDLPEIDPERLIEFLEQP